MSFDSKVFDLLEEWSRSATKPSVRELCEKHDALHLEAQVAAALRDLCEAEKVWHHDDSPLLSTSGDSEKLPESIGPYRIVRRIGSGAMGIVYEAKQLDPERSVALKVMRVGHSSPALRRRFRQEVAALALLNHEGIARIYHAGVTAPEYGQPYFAMEFVDGVRLDDWIKSTKPTLRDRLRMISAICAAVQHAHQKGIIHRDLKPANILVTGANEPKVLDFGVARLISTDNVRATLGTQPDTVVGTLAYMSPEQANGNSAEVDTRSDVYSLGVIAFEVLTGRFPYDLPSTSIIDAAHVIKDANPPRLGTLDRTLRGDVETIVGKALEKEKVHRYGSSGELGADITRHLAYEPITARKPNLWYLLSRMARRNRAASMAALALFIVVVAALVLFKFQLLNLQKAQEKATVAANSAAALRVGQSRFGAEGQDPLLGLLRQVVWLRQEELMDLKAFVAGDRQRLASDLRNVPRLVNLLPGADERLGLERMGFRARVVADEKQEGQYQVQVTDAKGAPVLNVAHAGKVTAMAFSPDGNRLLTASIDGTVSLFDLTTRREVWPRLQHQDAVTSASFSADGTKIVTTCRDHAAYVWDALSGDLVTPIEGHSKEVECAAFTPDGKRVVTGAWDQWIRMSDAATGKKIWDAKIKSFVMCLAISPDGKTLAAGGYHGIVRLFKAETGEPIPLWNQGRQHDGEVRYLKFNDSSGQLLSGSSDRTLRVWDGHTLEPLGPQLWHPTTVERGAWDATGDHIFTLGADGVTRTWRVGQDLSRATLVSKDASVVCYSPDRSKIMVTTGTKHAGLFNAADLSPIPTADATASVRAPFFTRAGPRVVAEIDDAKKFQVCDAITGRPCGQSIEIDDGGVWEDFELSPLGDRIATVSKKRVIQVWDIETGKVAYTIGGPGSDPNDPSWLNANFSPDGQLLSTSGWGGSRIWDAATGSPISTRLLEHPGRVHYARFSRDGKRVLTCSWDGTARVWKITGEPVTEPMLHIGPVADANFSPDGKRVITGSEDHTARVWDAATGKPLTPPLPHEQTVNAVDFLGDKNDRAFTRTLDGDIVIWDLNLGLPLSPSMRLGLLPNRGAFTLDMSEAIGVTSGQAHIWRILPPSRNESTADLLRLAELLAARRIEPNGAIVPLTLDEWTRHWNDLHKSQPGFFTGAN